MMNLYYENHLGERIHFYRSPYILTDHGLFNWVLTYNTVRNRSSGFRLDPVERNVTIMIVPTARTRLAREAMFAELYDRFLEVISADVETSGKLWTDTGEYLECRFIADDKSLWNLPRSTTLTCRVLIDYPKWQKPTTYSLDALFGGAGSSGSSGSGSEGSGSEGTGSSDASGLYPFLDYPMGYMYDYKGIMPAQKTIMNEGTEPSDYVLVIEGAAYNPKIVINGVPIGAYVMLGSGEQLEIDTKNKTIYKISNGIRTNVFNKRYKGAVSMFEKLPVGEISVLWDGNLNATITVMSERLEPKWS